MSNTIEPRPNCQEVLSKYLPHELGHFNISGDNETSSSEDDVEYKGTSSKPYLEDLSLEPSNLHSSSDDGNENSDEKSKSEPGARTSSVTINRVQGLITDTVRQQTIKDEADAFNWAQGINMTVGGAQYPRRSGFTHTTTLPNIDYRAIQSISVVNVGAGTCILSDFEFFGIGTQSTKTVSGRHVTRFFNGSTPDPTTVSQNRQSSTGPTRRERSTALARHQRSPYHKATSKANRSHVQGEGKSGAGAKGLRLENENGRVMKIFHGASNFTLDNIMVNGTRVTTQDVEDGMKVASAKCLDTFNTSKSPSWFF